MIHCSSVQSVLFHLCFSQLINILDQNKFPSKSKNTETERGWEICFYGNCAVSLAWLLGMRVSVCVSDHAFRSIRSYTNIKDSHHFVLVIHHFYSFQLLPNQFSCYLCFSNDVRFPKVCQFRIQPADASLGVNVPL